MTEQTYARPRPKPAIEADADGDVDQPGAHLVRSSVSVWTTVKGRTLHKVTAFEGVTAETLLELADMALLVGQHIDEATSVEARPRGRSSTVAAIHADGAAFAAGLRDQAAKSIGEEDE
jgi:hypothetical protein